MPDRATRPPPDLGPTPALTVGLPPPRLTGRRKALLVGINNRGTRAELRGCHNDVASLFDLLTHKYGWDRTCVHALVDDGRRGFAGEPTARTSSTVCVGSRRTRDRETSSSSRFRVTARNSPIRTGSKRTA